jgi:hypothetical protein
LPDYNAPGQSVREAAARLGVMGLVTHEGGVSGPVWWALRGPFDEERFRLLTAAPVSAAGMR